MSKKNIDVYVTPQTKSDVTKKFMEKYIEEIANPEERKWFQDLINKPEYQMQRINPFTKEPYPDIKLAEVRKEFCKRFFPNIYENKKTDGTKKEKPKTFIERINALK